MTQEHILTVKNSEIIRQLEARSFKFGKARDNGQADKLINNVKVTDMPYERDMVYMWIKQAIYTIKATFIKYSCCVSTEYEPRHQNENDYLITHVKFCMSSKWPQCNGDGFDADCNEYVVNRVLSEFLSLSLPREADLYATKAMQALKDAERKLYFKFA